MLLTTNLTVNRTFYCKSQQMAQKHTLRLIQFIRQKLETCRLVHYDKLASASARRIYDKHGVQLKLCANSPPFQGKPSPFEGQHCRS